MRVDSQSPTDLVQAYLRGWATGDLALLDRVLAPDVEYRERGRRHDRAGLYQSMSQFCQVFTNRGLTADLWLVDGDLIACHYTFEGSHTGRQELDPTVADLIGAPALAPTGRRVRATGTLICEVHEGRIHRVVSEFDQLALLTTMGALPSDAPEIIDVPDLEQEHRRSRR